jgi:P4 family phage/plasmid primase-like protien
VSKVPVDPQTGDLAKSNDSETWTTLEKAQQYDANNSDIQGIGFMFDAEGLVAGVDLDDCRNPETSEIDAWARDVVDRLDSFTEVSPSGTGLHIYALGFLPDGRNRSDVGDGEIEMYDGKSARYFTVTGNYVEGTPKTVEQRNDALSDIHAEYVADDEPEESDIETTPEPTDIGDSELVKKAKNADDGGKFKRLWNGDTSSYPSHSEARMALLTKLAFWTGGDSRQMDSLFRESGLYPHPEKGGKWDRVGDGEIDRAIQQVSEFYNPDHGSAATDGGATTEQPATPDTEPTRESHQIGAWEHVKEQYRKASKQSSPIEKNDARFAAAEQLLDEFHFANREDDDALFVYDPESGIYTDNGESVIRQRTREGLQGAFARQEVGELGEHIRAAETYTVEEFGGPEWHIAVQNGVLRLDRDGSRELLDHDPDYLFINQAGTEYDPDADCPTWKSYLQETVKSDTHRMKLQEYAGYTLMHWGIPEHKALFLVGPQASGKSTFADTIRALLGGSDNVASLSPQQMTDRFGTAELFGTWANIRNDIPPDTIQETGTFKEITAGDPIKGERKGKPLFHFRPNAKHIFSANQLPDAEEDDGAFYRRILLVPFPTTIPREQRDKKLPDKLRAELPGILNWALEGLARLLRENGFTGDLSVRETAETWDKWGNTVDRFAKACLNVSVDGDPKPKSDVYRLYQQFCDDENFPAETQRQLTRRLKTEHGVEDGKATVDRRQQRCFLNLEYTSRAEQYQDRDSDDVNGSGLGDYS